MSSPLKSTRPPGGLRPPMTFKSVVFPAPFGPVSPAHSPPFNGREIPSRALEPPAPGPEPVRVDSVLPEQAGEARDPAAAERAQELLRPVHHEDEAQEETQDQAGQPLQPLEPLWHWRPRFLSGHTGPSPQCVRWPSAIRTAPRMPASGPSPQRQSGG